MVSKTAINETPIWAQLHQHQRATKFLHMRDLFAMDENRFDKMHIQLHGLLFDYSKNRITTDTLNLLVALANKAKLSQWTQDMRTGVAINTSENRAVLHTALRAMPDANIVVDGINVVPAIQAALNKALNFAQPVYQGQYTGYKQHVITDVVNIGIGGSDLGPQMACLALSAYQSQHIHTHFIANVDGAPLQQLLAQLNPDTTLFIVASKSFTTPETLKNAQVAKDWLLQSLPVVAIGSHMVAISSNIAKAVEFGIHPDHVFPMFDWVGGRYSVWSSIGLSLMCSIGTQNFMSFLDGAREMDAHFYEAPFLQNIPVLMALIGLWYNTFYAAHSHAVIPYDHGLRRFPAHLQQLDMESNGKSYGRSGAHLDFDTGPIIWGEEGVNCQHAFFQLLHQGTRLIPTDFIVPVNSHYPSDQHATLVANALAQAQALMQGKTETQVYAELSHLSGIKRDELMPQKLFKGNQPSNMFMLDKVTPFNLGMLLAAYEHKVFVQGVVWGINSFDQWGVEYGKVLAAKIEPELCYSDKHLEHDASTNGLINHFRTHHV